MNGPSQRDDEARGRAAFEAFTASVNPWLPMLVRQPWEKVPEALRIAWIAAAKAARAT